ncbi:MAG: hypothetical protein ACK5NK_07985 [Niabella sp.]
MAIQKLNSQQYFNGLYVMQVAFIIGLFLFTMIMIFLRLTGGAGAVNGSLNGSLQILVPLIFGICVLAAYFIYRKKCFRLKKKEQLNEKLMAYRGIFVMRSMLLEAPAIFSIIAFMLTGNYLFVGITATSILLFIVLLPSKEKIANDIDLNTEDRMLINNPDTVVVD